VLKQLDRFNTDFSEERFNSENKIFWDNELLADSALFIKKKKYCAHMVEDDGVPCDKLLVKGLDIIRSSTAKKFREVLKETVELVLKGKSEVEIDNHSYGVYNDFRTWDINTIAIPKSVNNLEKFNNDRFDIELKSGDGSKVDLSDKLCSFTLTVDTDKGRQLKKISTLSVKNRVHLKQTNGRFKEFVITDITRQHGGIDFVKSTPQQVKSAIAYNYYLKKYNLVDYEPLKDGDKFKMLILRKGNPLLIGQIGYNDKLIPEFDIDESYVDKKKLFELGYMSLMEKIYEAMGWKIKDYTTQKQAIDDLFD